VTGGDEGAYSIWGSNCSYAEKTRLVGRGMAGEMGKRGVVLVLGSNGLGSPWVLGGRVKGGR